DKPVALAVDLEDLDADALPDQLLEVRAVGAGDLGGRQEAAQAQDIDDQAALVLLADLGVHHLAGGLLILRLDPDRLGACAAQRQDDVAVLVFRLQYEDLDVVAGVQVGRSCLTGPQFPAGDDALGFRADIDQNLVGIDPDDDTIDDVTVGYALTGSLLLIEELLHRRGASILRVGRVLRKLEIRQSSRPPPCVIGTRWSSSCRQERESHRSIASSMMRSPRAREGRM